MTKVKIRIIDDNKYYWTHKTEKDEILFHPDCNISGYIESKKTYNTVKSCKYNALRFFRKCNRYDLNFIEVKK